MSRLNFNASEVEPLETYEAIPTGDYEAVITESGMKANKSGTGSYLELKTEIIEGDYKGRKLTARLNLENPSVKAVQMARRELSSICHAVGVLNPVESEELHNIPLMMHVKKVKREDGSDSNEIGGWRAKAGASATPAQKAAQTATQGTAPWAR